jgi:uncharacterized protein (TIGR02118 family)
MIKVSVLYPATGGAAFDMNYYLNTHIPLVQDRLGAALKGVHVDEGIGAIAPGAPAPFAAIGHLLFDSVEAFQAAFGPHMAEIVGDVKNYTSIEPTVQISQVKF